MSFIKCLLVFVCFYSMSLAKSDFVKNNSEHGKIKEGLDEEESDIKSIKWLPTIARVGYEKKLIIELEDGRKETIVLREKPSILNKNVKIISCTKKGSCQETKIPNIEEKCTFTGNFENDLSSQAVVVGCNDEVQDMVLLSDKIKLQSTSYRARMGKVFTSKKTFNMSISDVIKNPKQLHRQVTKHQGNLKKIYNSKTLEVGVVVDPDMYLAAKAAVEADRDSSKNKIDNQIERKIVSQVKQLLTRAEAFLQHKTISSSGGFSVKLNGIKIFQTWKDNPAMAKERSLSNQLTHFRKLFVKNYIDDDADVDHHDVSLLFTGRKYLDAYFGDHGEAYTDSVCTNWACAALTVFLDRDGQAPISLGRLLAHEIGHILGAKHDVTETSCGPNFIMQTTVSRQANEWSECSRKGIDDESSTEKNCYFT